MKQRQLLVLCGGRSSEHAVSLESAKNVVSAIDESKNQVWIAGISTKGVLHLLSPEELAKTDVTSPIDVTRSGKVVSLSRSSRSVELIEVESGRRLTEIDLVFPVLHGPFGEDGSVQGWLKFLGVPFVGASVLGSAVGMDKVTAKRLMRATGLPHGRFEVLTKAQFSQIHHRELAAKLGSPFFVKPSNMGSSIGVHKVKDAADLGPALKDAFQYDTMVLAEEAIDGREIECSVLGDFSGAHPMVASLPGEVIPSHDFYSYEAKYLDANGAKLQIPADVPIAVADEVRRLALECALVLQVEGLARVDFFLRRSDQKLLINEINTMPGFTKISMYPKMLNAVGIPYTEIIDRLIRLALERFAREQTLAIDRVPRLNDDSK
jgi:D-alanine-D-alanine ligase